MQELVLELQDNISPDRSAHQDMQHFDGRLYFRFEQMLRDLESLATMTPQEIVDVEERRVFRTLLKG